MLEFEALRLDRISLKLLGIINADDERLYYRINYIACMVIPVVFLSPVLWYFFTYFTDVAKATSAFYMICVVGMAASAYSELLRKRSTISSVLHRIQSLVDNASNDSRSIYEEAELYAHNLCHYYKIFIFCSVFGVVSLPISVMIVVSIIGGETTDWRILPVSMKLPWMDIEEWSGYTVGYILSYLAAFFVSRSAALYGFPISIALYVNAGFNEIRLKLKSVDQHFTDPTTSSVLHVGNVNNNLVNIWKAHLNVLEIVEKVDFFLTGTKYCIFTFGSLLLCTGLFQVQQNALDGSVMIFQLVVASGSDILVLFMFCISGEIIIHSYDISTDVYSLRWYELDATSKFAVYFMIARTQQPYRFTSYQSINCSMETFVVILQKAGAVLAMLQSI